jgi:hypothetical protein
MLQLSVRQISLKFWQSKNVKIEKVEDLETNLTNQNSIQEGTSN